MSCIYVNISLQLLPHTGSALSAPMAIGVVGVVLPDTKPLLSMVSVLGATVSMGNAIIMVPSERFPLPALDFIPVNLHFISFHLYTLFRCEKIILCYTAFLEQN